MENTLTPKQKVFIEYYLANGYNGAAAALAAGYSKNTAAEQAYQLLKKPYMVEAIRKHQHKTATKLEISKEEIITNLYNIMLSEGARNSDRIKASEVLMKALGFNEPDKIEHSGEMLQKIINVRYRNNDEENLSL